MIEDDGAGFTSIPRSIYWAIVTLTTVGYGDISPKTGLGQTVAAMIMILGYSIIVIPTGIIAASVPKALPPNFKRPCRNCQHTIHDDDANYCNRCGQALNDVL
jgi:voltage-gated potassium channel